MFNHAKVVRGGAANLRRYLRFEQFFVQSHGIGKLFLLLQPSCFRVKFVMILHFGQKFLRCFIFRQSASSSGIFRVFRRFCTVGTDQQTKQQQRQKSFPLCSTFIYKHISDHPGSCQHQKNHKAFDRQCALDIFLLRARTVGKSSVEFSQTALRSIAVYINTVGFAGKFLQKFFVQLAFDQRIIAVAFEMFFAAAVNFRYQCRHGGIAQTDHQQPDIIFFQLRKFFTHTAGKFFAISYQHHFARNIAGGFQSLECHFQCLCKIGSADRHQIALQLINTLFQTYGVCRQRTQRERSSGKSHKSKAGTRIAFDKFPCQKFAVFQARRRHIFSKHTFGYVKNDQHIAFRQIEFQRPLSPAGSCGYHAQKQHGSHQYDPPQHTFGVRADDHGTAAGKIFQHSAFLPICITPEQYSCQQHDRQQPQKFMSDKIHILY